MKRLLGVSLIVILIDRLTKILAVSLGLGNEVIIIKKIFSITCAYNYGAAWSIFMGHTIGLIIITLIVLLLIYFFFIKNKVINKKDAIIYGLLIGGIVGNLIDRIIYGYVIDFLDFTIFGYDYPIFNIADSMIVISIFLCLYSEIKGDNNASTKLL